MSPDSLLHMEDKHFEINLGDSILYDKPVAKLNYQERFQETLVEKWDYKSLWISSLQQWGQPFMSYQK